MSEIENQNFDVVMNHEEQYSIWPTSKEIPAGWKKAGFDGDREQCLAFIREIWTDMRPLSVRQQMMTQGGE